MSPHRRISQATVVTERNVSRTKCRHIVISHYILPDSKTLGGSSGAGRNTSKVVASAAAAEGAEMVKGIPLEVDDKGNKRLAYQKDGYRTWKWKDHSINWISAGDSGPVVLLIHGFGASVYHWRYILPELSKDCRVYALDCLGFGWSDKALVDYEGYDVWTEQISDFLKEVVHEECGKEKVTLVGNSLGGYNSMATAAQYPDLIQSVVLLNAAGRFDFSSDSDGIAPAAELVEETGQLNLKEITTKISTAIRRAVVGASFILAKQPARVKQVLRQVYWQHDNIDDDLVASIVDPAQHPNSSEVFYRVITSRGKPINKLLDSLKQYDMPLFLLWGSEDPWCVPANATRIVDYYPTARRVDITSGHCPHDDTPETVIKELMEYMSTN